MFDDGVTDRQTSLSLDDQAKFLSLRCSYAHTVDLWVF
jgi:hypothetical protein